MIIKQTLMLLAATIFISCNNVKSTSKNDTSSANTKTYKVSFECGSCKTNNAFSISGMEEHSFKKVVFPLKQELSEGDYEMTYWQNKVQQIHLPFSVRADDKNVIVVKE